MHTIWGGLRSKRSCWKNNDKFCSGRLEFLTLGSLASYFSRSHGVCFEGSKVLHPVVCNWLTQWQTVNPARGDVNGEMSVGVLSESRGLKASILFFPLSHPLPSTFLVSPYFSRGPNANDPSRSPNFVRVEQERLLRRQHLRWPLNNINELGCFPRQRKQDWKRNLQNDYYLTSCPLCASWH